MSKKYSNLTISVSRSSKVYYDYVMSKPNRSQYIWDLVKQDMEQQETNSQILQYVKQAFNTQNLNELNSQIDNSQGKQTTSNTNDNKSNENLKKSVKTLWS